MLETSNQSDNLLIWPESLLHLLIYEIKHVPICPPLTASRRVKSQGNEMLAFFLSKTKYVVKIHQCVYKFYNVFFYLCTLDSPPTAPTRPLQLVYYCESVVDFILDPVECFDSLILPQVAV